MNGWGEGVTSSGSDSWLLLGCGRLDDGLRQALGREGRRTAVAQDLGDAVREISVGAHDLVLLGERIPDPIGAIEELRRVGRTATILFLSGCARPDVLMDAMMAGADDVVCPPHSASSILVRAEISRFRALGSRFRHDPGAHWVLLGGLQVDVEGRRVYDGDRAIHLTGREFELLLILLEARGMVVPRERIIEDIWGEEQESEAVLDATVHRLRRKLEEDLSEPRLITTVRGVGYRLEAGGVPHFGESLVMASA